MPNKRRHRGGRVTPKGTRPFSYREPLPPPTGLDAVDPDFGDDQHAGPDDLDLVRNIRGAVAADHPLDLLNLVSSLLVVMDARGELMRSFVEVDIPETSALLAVIAALTSDELERVRLRRALADRSLDQLPAWIQALDGADAYAAIEMVDVLGDGDNILVGVRLPGGAELTAVVYIDHNMGTQVKDAFILAKPMADLVASMRSIAGDQDTTWNAIDRADARARIEQGIATWEMFVPPLETDTWPMCRALVEWIARRLPASGRGYQRPVWDERDRRALPARFLASPFAAELKDPDQRAIVDDLVAFACDDGPGDPLRWSPVAVEILLVAWLPHHVLADADYLSKAPKVLRAFIRFCHHDRGIRAALTSGTLEAVDRWEPDYQFAIRSPRRLHAAALLTGAGQLDEDDDGDDTWDDDPYGLWSTSEFVVNGLLRGVGGAEALAALGDDPLPDEGFVWDGIPTDVHDRVAEVLELCDGCCADRLDLEYRTVCRRLLARIAIGDPNIFRRKGSARTAAAAICWVACQANDRFSSGTPRMSVAGLLAYFGIDGSVSQRAGTFLKAGGFERDLHYNNRIFLGSPDLLVSSRRRRMIELRERWSES